MHGPEGKAERRPGVARSRALAVVAGALLIVGLGATGGVAATLITSADIKNESVRAVDLAPGAVGSGEVADGSVKARDLGRHSVAAGELRRNSVGGSQIRADAVSGDELSNALVRRINNAGDYVGPNWGIVDRKVLGGGDAYLRTGPSSTVLTSTPVSPPLGIGSLGLRTGSGGDRAAFGNQVTFNGDLVSSLTTLAFSVFTTDENNRRGNNMPSIVIEIDPNLAAAANVDYASMVYTPANGQADRWTFFDATDNTQGRVWGLTGAAGSAVGCAAGGGGCTWDQILNRLEDGDGNQARIHSVQIVKGANFVFSGAVDNLRIRDQVYDFEPLGVRLH
jgi:hypothetical protein